MRSFESRPAQQLPQHMTRATQPPEMTAIQRDDEARALARALTTRVSRLPARTTPAVRTVRREFSRRIATHSTDVVLRAVRELAKTHPAEARRFLAAIRPVLAARVVREVSNKLETGLKTPRRRPES